MVNMSNNCYNSPLIKSLFSLLFVIISESSRLRVLKKTTTPASPAATTHPPRGRTTSASTPRFTCHTKTTTKTICNDEMADIAVWINGREKLLTGVSKSTTCQDIVRTLLEDDLRIDKVPRAIIKNFALYERWRDCERPLAPRTRVYKLWKAWGAEQENVKFTMKKCSGVTHRDSCGMDDSGRGSRDKARKDRTRRQSYNGDRRHHSKGLSMRRGNVDNNNTRVTDDRRRSRDSRHDKGRDILLVVKSEDSTGSSTSEAEFVSSDVCGPEIIGTDDPSSGSLPDALMNLAASSSLTTTPPSADIFRNVFQMVLQQSQQLEGLLEQAQCIDREIEFYETKMHLLRVEENGKNYVQDAYLASAAHELPHPGTDTESKMAEIINGMYPHQTEGSGELEAYIDLCERILGVEDQLSAKRSTISTLSCEIERERAVLRQSRQQPAASSVVVTRENLPFDGGSTELDKMSYHDAEILPKFSVVHQSLSSSSSRSPDYGLTTAQLKSSAQTLVAHRTEISTMQKQLQSPAATSSSETVSNGKSDWMNVLNGELLRLEETEQSMMTSLSSSSSSMEVTTSEEDDERSSEKRLQKLLQLVRQPLQPIQEIPEDDIGQYPDGIHLTANEEECMMSKKMVSDDSSDTGLSSLHSQDDQDQFFEIITETLV